MRTGATPPERPPLERFRRMPKTEQVLYQCALAAYLIESGGEEWFGYLARLADWYEQMVYLNNVPDPACPGWR